MKKIIKLMNFLLKFIGLKITIDRVVRNRKTSVLNPKKSNSSNSKSIVLIYLDVGINTEEFVLNSIISFRKFDSDTDIIVYTNDIQKKEIYLLHNLNVQLKEIEGFQETNESNEYFEIGTQEFIYINNLKWTIILSTFSLGYSRVTYSDFDIVFLDSPINYINKFTDSYWLMIQSESQNQYPPKACNGFMVFNELAIPMISELQHIGKNYNKVDQVLLNSYIKDLSDSSQKIHYLSEALFSNGLHWKSLVDTNNLLGMNVYADSIKPILFHANFLVGLESKKLMLEQLNLWNI